MARKFEELRAAMTPEARAASAEMAAQMLAEMPLSVLRAARGLTQQEIAHILGTTQASVSRMERREDVHLSSLRRYVSALGGELEVTARFPDCAIRVDVDA